MPQARTSATAHRPRSTLHNSPLDLRLPEGCEPSPTSGAAVTRRRNGAGNDRPDGPWRASAVDSSLRWRGGPGHTGVRDRRIVLDRRTVGTSSCSFLPPLRSGADGLVSPSRVASGPKSAPLRSAARPVSPAGAAASRAARTRAHASGESKCPPRPVRRSLPVLARGRAPSCASATRRSSERPPTALSGSPDAVAYDCLRPPCKPRSDAGGFHTCASRLVSLCGSSDRSPGRCPVSEPRCLLIPPLARRQPSGTSRRPRM